MYGVSFSFAGCDCSSYDPEISWKREEDGKNHGEIDVTLAVSQMMLQAAELGLGTTYVGMFNPEKLLEQFPEMKGLQRQLSAAWISGRDSSSVQAACRSQAARRAGSISVKYRQSFIYHNP